MNVSSGVPSGNLQRAIEYLQKRQNALKAKKQERHYTIAISRQRGARGSQVAQEVGKQLGWHVYDRDLVEEIAGDKAVASTLIESVDERHQGWIVECVESFSQTPSITESAYVHRLVKTLASLAAHGECIIVGRGGGFALPKETTLRVGLIAPRKSRISRVARDNDVGESQAARIVDHTDQERVRFVKDHFHKDSRDWQHYDLILNTDRFDDGRCADVIVRALHGMQAEARQRSGQGAAS